jgi:hypothetical protein
MRKFLAGLAGTIQEQIVDEEWRQPQQIEESYCFPAEITWRAKPQPKLPRLELISSIRSDHLRDDLQVNSYRLADHNPAIARKASDVPIYG